MAVRRIVSNLMTPDPAGLAAFYGDVLGLAPQMDHGWITTLGTMTDQPVQLSLASGGGRGDCASRAVDRG